mmetsp:Transcript_25066/g.41601  ORF Transcript_25066/g.41601 Transcript_25066/m.41601 type:complete len:234 (+) Transcript_25066:679-1380(+)
MIFFSRVLKIARARANGVHGSMRDAARGRDCGLPALSGLLHLPIRISKVLPNARARAYLEYGSTDMTDAVLGANGVPALCGLLHLMIRTIKVLIVVRAALERGYGAYLMMLHQRLHPLFLRISGYSPRLHVAVQAKLMPVANAVQLVPRTTIALPARIAGAFTVTIAIANLSHWTAMECSIHKCAAALASFLRARLAEQYAKVRSIAEASTAFRSIKTTASARMLRESRTSII